MPENEKPVEPAKVIAAPAKAAKPTDARKVWVKPELRKLATSYAANAGGGGNDGNSPS